jgi:hypothetical protein
MFKVDIPPDRLDNGSVFSHKLEFGLSTADYHAFSGG